MDFAARVVLGAVFVASGIIKLRDPAWPDAARRFGAPAWSVRPLPWVEVAIGVLLGAQVRPAAAAALLLLGAFTVLVVDHLRRGDRVPCACFGRVRPVSGADVVRNVVLIGLAVVALL